MRHPIESPLATPAAILLGSIIIAGAIVTSLKDIGRTSLQSATTAVATAPSPAGQQTAPQATAKAVDSSKVNTVGEPFIGNPSAAVTIAYWYDYQCPFCRQNEETVMPQLIKDYVDAGKVKIVFKDFQFLGEDSVTLATVSRAVWDLAPSKFYAWHKAIFDAQGRENSGWATKDRILSVTTGVLGADLAKSVMARADQNSTAYQSKMDADKSEGALLGISGTPAVIIGKSLIVGARPYDMFKTAIETALSGK